MQDMHIGKEGNDDIIQQYFASLAQLTENVSNNYFIDDLIYVIGGDILNMDTFNGTTTSGTPVENSDKAHKVYAEAFDALYKGIRFLKERCESLHIMYIPGNHDEFLRKYTPMELGNIQIVDEFVEDGVWYCHGDKYDGIVQMHWLGVLGSIGYDLAIVIDRFLKKFNRKTSLSKYLKDNVKAAISFMVDFENEMARQAKKRNCHTVVCGHIHAPSDKNVDGVHYLNCGDWVENCSYIVLENNKFTLIKSFNYLSKIIYYSILIPSFY